jgi:hypothetical protein
MGEGGGMLSALTGTGANVLVFLFLVVLAGTNRRLPSRRRPP